VKDNVFLGEITLPVPPRPAGQVSVAIRFTYDVNGLLEAEMTVEATGEKHRLIIEENPGVLTPAQIEEKLAALAKLKIHPRELLPNATLLARADRLYQQTLGDQRAWIAQETARFQALLEQQDEAAINEARESLKRLLDDVEGESWL
jgi:molecular chaperone HscC